MSEDCLKYVFILNPRGHLKTHLYSLNIFLTFSKNSEVQIQVCILKTIDVILESWTWKRTGDFMSFNFLSVEAFHTQSSLTSCTSDHCMNISKS